MDPVIAGSSPAASASYDRAGMVRLAAAGAALLLTVALLLAPGPAAATDPCRRGGSVLCALNPDVTQASIGTTICVAGWTARVRPASSYTSALKLRQLARFATQHRGDASWTAAGTEEDHRMPLTLGGAPREEVNLSPELPGSPNPKDDDERRLGQAVCRRELTLAAARAQLARKWLAPWPGYRGQGRASTPTPGPLIARPLSGDSSICQRRLVSASTTRQPEGWTSARLAGSALRQ
jgi:hypothetical protein